jgi:diguanylate cyclase (GGDEF)-like protein
MIRFAETFGTRVGQRLLVLFLVCALLPIGLAGALSYGKIRDALVNERVLHLGQAAEGYGTTLLERLLLADQLVRSLAAAPERAAADGATFETHFAAAALLRPGAPPRVLSGRWHAAPQEIAGLASHPHLASGESVVRTLDGRAGPQVWLARAIEPGNPAGGLVVAQLNPAYLWGNADELPFATDLCVLDARRRPLHCSAPMPARVLEEIAVRLQSGPSGHYAWDSAEGKAVASYREVFLEAKFRAGSWPVVVSQPEEYALMPVRDVAGLVLPVIALALLVAAGLGIVQVRGTMRPLAALTAATRRIAARDFQTRVPAATDDEFGELATALNAMSERLGRQFHALGALAQIDSVILSKVDVDRIVAIVLTRLEEVTGAELRLLLLAEDPDCATRFNAFSYENSAQAVAHGPIEIAASEAQRLQAAQRGMRIEPGSAAHSAIAHLAGDSRAPLYAVPILLDGALAGAIVLRYPQSSMPDEDESRLVQDLGDRVAVALATAARDRELYRRAHYDPLTQLPNRQLFREEFGRELARAERHGHRLALLFIDLDGFSQVNDTLGHAAGDQVLVLAAERLRSCVRKSDLVARLAGDEFTVVLPELRDVADAATVARHLIETLSQPYRIGHSDTFVAASVGIAVYPGDGSGVTELLQHADMAMYRAKQQGRGNHVFFESGMNHEAQRRMVLDRELRHALQAGEFVLYYQPQFDLRADRIVGAEALIRWMHPTRGVVAPGPFISFAEETGLIEGIGAWVLAEAARQFTAWRAEGLPLEHISVNVSPRQFRRPDFAETVAEVVRRSGIDPRRLHLEITESVLVDGAAADAMLAQLTALGTPLELDDFGTGYSSLAYLQRLPVGIIKLERSFIKAIAQTDNSQAIVRAAIGMVHALKKEVVAEGVETAEQLTLLRQWGCDAIQGFLLSQPVPAAAFAELVRNPPQIVEPMPRATVTRLRV